MIETRLLIGGQWRDAADGGTFESVNPATGEAHGRCALARETDADDAVEAARDALDNKQWRGMLPAQRARLLWRIADLIEDHGDELAALETADQGQLPEVARGVSVAGAAEHFRYYAGWATKIAGEAQPPATVPDVLAYTRLEPAGVCALITPWNFPLMIAAWKLAPALACGNTVIMKPAEQTPLTTVRLAGLCARAGVPDGVVNLLTGGPGTGKALTEHPGIDKVSFTGSTETGRQIVIAAAGNLKRLSLELGGKAPSIVLPDADMDAAVAGNVAGGLFNGGQVCAAYTRIFVPSRRAQEFTEKAAVAAAKMPMGPLVTAEHRAHVDALVQAGEAQGADLAGGGAIVDGPGWYYRPAVFGGVRDEMTIARDEIFGPVLSVLAYEDEDEAVQRANATEYGLAASVWTRDVAWAHRVAAALKAGTVWINMANPVDPALPFGGFKASGWGREMGRQAIGEYTEVKSVWTALG